MWIVGEVWFWMMVAVWVPVAIVVGRALRQRTGGRE